MNEVISHPSQIRWYEGPLPDVHTVPYDCRILAWFVHDFREDERRVWGRDMQGRAVDPSRFQDRLARIEMVLPHKDDLNPLRWCDSRAHPVGLVEKVQFWSWITRGEEKSQEPWQQAGF